MGQESACRPYYRTNLNPLDAAMCVQGTENCNSVSEHICLLSPEHPDITLTPIVQAFSPVSPMMVLSDRPNSEFVNNYNLRCTVDLLADEIVATEIDQKESDSEGEDLPGDILPCDDHPRCAYYTGHSSIYETVET